MRESDCLEVYHIESMGTLDGPGIRTVIFLQGCPLRCDYCHNPDAWAVGRGQIMTFDELLKIVKRNQAYFGNEGGVTLSGGEPLLQADCLINFIHILKAEGIHITLDTSGYILNDVTRKVLKSVDLVLLDIKAFDDTTYIEISKISNHEPLKTLDFLRNEEIKHWIRHVKLPGRLFDSKYLSHLASHEACDKYEVLDYHNMGAEKWEAWQTPFRKNYSLI